MVASLVPTAATLGSGAACAVLALIAVLALRGHNTATAVRILAPASAVVGAGLGGIALLANSAILPMLLGSTAGAAMIGAGAGLAASESARLAKRALEQ